MKSFNHPEYTDKQILDALNGIHGARKIRFKYELLDKNNRKIRDLKNVTSAEISQSMLAQIKRTASFSLIEDGCEIDYLNDRIKPSMCLWVSPSRRQTREFAFLSHIHAIELSETTESQSAGWVDFPLGVFLMSSPTRRDENGAVHRDIDAYDLSQILLDDKFIDRYTIEEGTNYYEAIVTIITSSGITLYNIEQTDKLLNRTLEFEPGVSKLEAVNELLSQLNYTPLHVDEVGYFTSREYITPSERSADYYYIDDKESVIHIGAEEELDVFNVANVFSVVRTNEEEVPLMSTYINDNPDSPTSTVSRDRKIVDHREIEDIADQEALDAYVERIAFEASQVYGRIRFKTALMPFHGYSNVLHLSYEDLGINGNYLELNWTMKLEVGGEHTHELRQVVTV